MVAEKISRDTISKAFQAIQTKICEGLQAEDGLEKFSKEPWQHQEGGGGLTRVISRGNVFEKGGVNFSAVEGRMPEFMKEKLSSPSTHFFATGVSLVIHPQSPMVPIVHMNIRYFETDSGECWFGGGIDLTPIYVDKEQASYFHSILRKVCDRFNPEYYSRFKAWADDYFYIKHRNETRGIGGIFFDYLKADEHTSIDDIYQFVQAVGNAFLDSYLPIVNQNKTLPYTEAEKNWQLLRRGRYVEFNLVYDRGTRFGLETGGRTESILMSLPEHASWIYNHHTAPGSKEETTLNYLKKGIDW